MIVGVYVLLQQAFSIFSQVLELIANACVPVTNLVKEMDEAEKSMSEGQIELLTSQLQQVRPLPP